MGRAPCCDKANVKRGPWSPEEDAKLKAYIESNGTGGNWIALPKKIGIKRCGKSCRLRWLNYLRPNIRHGGFSDEEDNIICSLYLSIGSRWSIIAAQLSGRTDNDIKNYWNTKLKKKLLGRQRKEQQARRANWVTIKQEMKRETQSYIVPGMVLNQASDWPPQVMPLTNLQDSHLMRDDQDSIRNLLVKQGGRFSDDHHPGSSTMSFQYPLDHVPFSQHQLHENSMNMLSSESSLSTTPLNSTCSQVTNSTTTTTTTITTTHFNVNDVGGGPNDVFQGLDGLQAELSELIYNNNEHILNGFEGFYGTDNMADGSGTVTSSVESSSWGDTAYPQIVSVFETSQQQGSSFDESSYFGTL